jgi:hypothetical protein
MIPGVRTAWTMGIARPNEAHYEGMIGAVNNSAARASDIS